MGGGDEPHLTSALTVSVVWMTGYIYTGLKDGWVVEIKPTGQVRKILRMSIRSCGELGLCGLVCLYECAFVNVFVRMFICQPV